MIKVCHLTTAHSWNDVRIFEKECRSLAANGFDVYIIAFNTEDQIEDKVRIVNAGKRPRGRLKRMLFGPKIILKKALEIDADIYHFHDPELLPISKKLKKCNKKVVYDIHEDVPRQILDKPYLNRFLARIISSIFERYENMSVKKIDGLICATPFIKNCFDKIHKNVYNINNFPLLTELKYNDTITTNKKNKICYIGSISEIRGILQLIDAMAFCNGTLLELGGVFEEEELRNKAKKSDGWKYVNEMGYINRKESQTVKYTSKAGLVTFLKAGNHINAQPNKFFEYMSAGLPVICSDFPLWRAIIENNNCGICVNPLNPKEIAEAINFIINNPEKANQMGENGRKAVLERYNWESEEKKLIDFYKKLSLE